MSDKRGRWLTLAAMTLASSMILVDQTAVPLATPEAIEDLGGQISQAQWIMTANIIPLAALMVLGQKLGSDSFQSLLDKIEARLLSTFGGGPLRIEFIALLGFGVRPCGT